MAKLEQMVVALGAVLRPYLDTRPVVGEHVIGSADQPLAGRGLRIGHRLARYAVFCGRSVAGLSH